MSADRKKDDPNVFAGMAFDEALARLVQTKPEEISDFFDQVKKDEEEAGRYVEERRESIRKGARRASKRFRL